MYGNLDISGNADIRDYLLIGGATYDPSFALNVSGDTHVSGNIDISGNADIRDYLLIGGATYDPFYMLDVCGNTHVSGNLDISGNADIRDYLLIGGATYDPSFALNVSGDTLMDGNVSVTGSSNFANMSIFKSNVSIGTDSTFTDVILNVSGNIECSGMLKTDEIAISSDYRIKSNVQSLDETYVVDDLKPVIYNKYDKKQKEIGFLAHELQDIYPDLVTGCKDDEDNMQKINYTSIIGILVNEIQNLKKRVEILEGK